MRQKKIEGDEIDAIGAFKWLVESADGREPGTVGRKAILIGALHIRQMSGCWPPEERPSEIMPKVCDRLDALLIEEGLE